ncbi:MAG: T9SS type A sorting domain-containing protein [Dyadobacter sp.]|uniref:T9SS type A sorting domain-containing protein n=1 Tax=Dyadobacter sp. TaxID=1914288 RepID=UPI001B0E36FB|nr:T9SS type A sorting domain-containing protein [Dyadobacter sp.]MBO9617244.1 T9SS type A sorting domain-containing protein [Dyadobacter sp.]
MMQTYFSHFSARWKWTALLIMLGAFPRILSAQCVNAGSPIHFTIAGNNTATGYTTVYLLTNSDGRILKAVTDGFAAPDVNGTYYLYAVNYKTSGTGPTMTPGTNIAAIGGDCTAASEQPAQFCVSGGCVPAGSSVAFQVTGHNTSAGYLTQYALTDSTGHIVSSHTESPITLPSAPGKYRIYAVNYLAIGGSLAPNLQAGTLITEIGGTCASASQTPIEVCAAPSMPVTLLSFSLAQEARTVRVNWVTTEEVNAEKFEIQRARDAKNWQAIGSQGAEGDSKVLVSYQFTDPAPLSGQGYYRLKMIDRDQSFTYSRIQSIRLGNKEAYASVYPNPTQDRLLLMKPEADVIRHVILTSQSGTTVFKGASFPTAGIDVRNIAAGTYLLKITWQNGQEEVHRIVVGR